jgi:hypothetical protein
MLSAPIGEILKNGVGFDMKNWSQGLPDGSDLPEAVDQVFHLLESRTIDYLLVGGIALLNYVEGRNTQDIDFILARQDISKIPEIALLEENRDFAHGQYGNLQIDFLLTQNPLFEWVQSTHGNEVTIDGRVIHISTVEGLVLLKLYALPSLYRQGKFDRVNLYEGDLTQLLMNYVINTESVLEKLGEFVLPSDLEEIRQIVVDIETRIRRFKTTRERLSEKEE